MEEMSVSMEGEVEEWNGAKEGGYGGEDHHYDGVGREMSAALES